MTPTTEPSTRTGLNSTRPNPTYALVFFFFASLSSPPSDFRLVFPPTPFSSAFLLVGFPFDPGLAASFGSASFIEAGLPLDFGFSSSAFSAFLDVGLPLDFGFSSPFSSLEDLDEGLSALLSAFFDAGLSFLVEAGFSDLSSLACFLDAGSSESCFFDAGFFPSSASFFFSDLGSGTPFFGSFFDPASFSYPPPAFSYSCESFVAYQWNVTSAPPSSLFLSTMPCNR